MLKAFETIGAKLAPKMVKLKAVSPHIAFAAGLVAMVGGTVYLCKQIHDLNENEELNELDEAKKVLDEAEEKLKDGTVKPSDEMNEEVIKEGRRKISWRAKKIIFKKCALAAAIIVVGAGAATGGHILLNNQKKDAIAFGNAAMAMYNGLVTRVKEELPKEEAAKLIFGKNGVIGTGSNERAIFKDNTIKEETGDDVPPWASEYDIILNPASTEWCSSPVALKAKIESILSSLQCRLRTRGFLYYWEAYEAFGYDKEDGIKMFGSDAGWVMRLPDGSEGYKDLDFHVVINRNEPQTQEFLNGYEPNVLLHLTPHGMVSDLLKRYDKAKRSGQWETPFEYRGSGVRL